MVASPVVAVVFFVVHICSALSLSRTSGRCSAFFQCFHFVLCVFPPHLCSLRLRIYDRYNNMPFQKPFNLPNSTYCVGFSMQKKNGDAAWKYCIRSADVNALDSNLSRHSFNGFSGNSVDWPPSYSRKRIILLYKFLRKNRFDCYAIRLPLFSS